METCNTKCKTWQQVLIEKGVESSISKSFIGFISWNKGEEFNKLGREITEIFSGYEGKVVAKDVVSNIHNDKGLLFFNADIPENIANEIFDTIMSYEQNEVYSTLN